MVEPFNFTGFLYVFEANWVWIMTALGLGVWFGWATAAGDQGKAAP